MIGNAPPQGAPPNLEQLGVPPGGIDRPRGVNIGGQQISSIADLLGGTANLVLQALQLPRRGVQTVLGGAGGEEGFRQNAIGQVLGNVMPNIAGNAIGGPAGPAIAQALLGKLPEEAQQAIRESSQDVLTDPMNLIGVGAFGKAANPVRQVVNVGGQMMPLGPEVASAYPQALLPVLRALDTGETLTQKALFAAITALPRAVRAGLQHVGAPEEAKVLHAKPVLRPGGVEATGPAREQATSIYDLLAAESGRSFYKQDVRTLGDEVANLVKQGVDPRRMIADEKDAATGGLLYKLPEKLAFSGKTVLEGREADLMARLNEAPNAVGQAAWLEVTRALETANHQAWMDAYTWRRSVPYSSGSTGQKVNNLMYKRAVDEVAKNYKAAFDVLDDAYGNARRIDLDPAAGAEITRTIEAALPTLERVMDTPSTGLYPIIAKGRRSVQDVTSERLAELTQRREGVNQLADQVRGIIEPLLGSPEAKGLTHPGALPGKMGERLSQLDFLDKQLPGEFANVPDFSKGLLGDTRHQMVRLAARAEKGRQAFEDGIRNIWEQYVPGQKFPEFDIQPSSTPEDVLGWVNQTLGKISSAPKFLNQFGGQPLPPVTNSIELLDVLRGYAQPEHFNRVNNLVNEFKGADLLTGSPFMAAWDRAARGLAARYGVDHDKNLKGTVLDLAKTGNAFFKEQALASYSFPLVNASGALFNSVLAGANPITLTTNLVKAMGEGARGVYEPPAHIRNFETRMGRLFGAAARGDAAAIQDATAQAVKEYTGTAIPVWQRIGQGWLGAGGAALGGASGLARTPDDADSGERARNALIGAGIGGAWFGGPLRGVVRAGGREGTLGKAADTALGLAGGAIGGHPGMAELVRRMSLAIEDVARKEVALMGSLTEHQNLLPAYQQVIRDAVAGARTPVFRTEFDPTYVGKRPPGLVGPPRIGQTVTIPPTGPATDVLKARSGAEGRITQALEQLDWQAPPEVVRQLLIEERVPPQAAQKAAETWRTINSNAIRAGEELAGEVHFDYNKNSNFEEWMREVAPFSTWAMKSLPFFAKHLAEKPLLLISVLQAEKLAEENRKEAGLPGRFAGAMHLSPADHIWSAILGHPVSAFMNPMRGLLPFSDTLRSVQEKPDANLFEQAVSALQAFGLPQPSPFLMTAARVTGALGDAPAQSMVRVGGPIQGVTAALGVNRGQGIDLGAAQEAIERNTRRAGTASFIGPQDVSNPAELGTMQRIDELYMRTFGRPISQNPGQEALPFMLAKVERSGPIWDAAAAEVAKDRGLRSAVGYVYNPVVPQAVLTPEEEAIRSARTQTVLSPKLARDVNDAAGTHPKEAADPSIVQAVSDASLALSQRTRGVAEQPPLVAKLLETPTNENVQKVVKVMQEVQAQINPLSTGYSVSGSPDEARLKAELALYSNVGLGVAGGAGQQLSDLQANLRGQGALAGAASGRPQLSSKGLNPISQILAQVGQAKDRRKAANPLMAKYLAWHQEHPTGDVDDFLKAERAGQLAGLQVTP